MNVNLFVGETDSRGYTLVAALNPTHLFMFGEEYVVENEAGCVCGLTLERACSVFNQICGTNLKYEFYNTKWKEWYSKLNKREDGKRYHVEDNEMSQSERIAWLKAHPEEVARIKAKYNL